MILTFPRLYSIKPALLKRTGCYGDRRSAAAEHLWARNSWVSSKDILFNPVLYHQKPSCQAGFCFMQFVAGCELSHRHALLLHDLQDTDANFLGIEEGGLEIGKKDTVARSGHLNETFGACLGRA